MVVRSADRAFQLELEARLEALEAAMKRSHKVPEGQTEPEELDKRGHVKPGWHKKPTVPVMTIRPREKNQGDADQERRGERSPNQSLIPRIKSQSKEAIANQPSSQRLEKSKRTVG